MATIASHQSSCMSSLVQSSRSCNISGPLHPLRLKALSSSCSANVSTSFTTKRTSMPRLLVGRPRGLSCAASKQEFVQGYTPANYITYTDGPQHKCHHAVAIEVDAPASICFDLWNDWCRMVDFLDLVAQIGLDPDEPDMGLFQCFYRWGRMPVMEIVFLAQKSKVEKDKAIHFHTVWGLPAQGSVEFFPSKSGRKTTVMFKLAHQLPWLLVDLKVGVPAVEIQMRDILLENLQEFKQLAETIAKDPANAPPPEEGYMSLFSGLDLDAGTLPDGEVTSIDQMSGPSMYNIGRPMDKALDAELQRQVEERLQQHQERLYEDHLQNMARMEERQKARQEQAGQEAPQSSPPSSQQQQAEDGEASTSSAATSSPSSAAVFKTPAAALKKTRRRSATPSAASSSDFEPEASAQQSAVEGVVGAEVPASRKRASSRTRKTPAPSSAPDADTTNPTASVSSSTAGRRTRGASRSRTPASQTL